MTTVAWTNNVQRTAYNVQRATYKHRNSTSSRTHVKRSQNERQCLTSVTMRDKHTQTHTLQYR